MNKINLKGTIENITYSHTINGVEYNKANLLVSSEPGREDVLSLCFKKFSCPYKEGQEVLISGNVRSFSQAMENGKNKVSIYVFTYFDFPEITEVSEYLNALEIDGRVCKVEGLRTTEGGKQNLHFILANNILSGDGKQKLNNYLPCVVWGKLAQEWAGLRVSDKIVIKGQLRSREYKKLLENGEIEFRVAHEILVSEISEAPEAAAVV